MSLRKLSMAALLCVPFLTAQEPVAVAPAAVETETEFSATEASLFTQKNARTMTLTIPAPRGLILDRKGRPFAQTKMAYYIALDFTKIDPAKNTEEAVVWGQAKIAESNQLTGGEVTLSDKKLSRYFKNRRWIPRVVSQAFDEQRAKKLEPQLSEGLTILPVYQRFYPQRKTAGHMVGYVATRKRLDDGPIAHGDPVFKTVEGRSGFEKVFDEDLRGIPGVKKVIFDGDGNKVLEESIRRPQPGGTVVTTLDLDWQRYAEKVLKGGCKRGALVVIDVRTGEIPVMASRPSYDPNEFIPYITSKRFKELNEDPAAPMYARAYQAAYPPASTFKPIVALAAISNGIITPETRIDSPYKIKIGTKWFRNHSKGNLGKISLNSALARSANPYFYRLGIMTGPQTFLSAARRLGYGSKTGLPLVGETPGRAPTPEFIHERLGRPTTDGDSAILAIGQGDLTASPLQVAQGMAGIANGEALLQVRLVKQVQDFHGRVIEAPTSRKRNDLSFSSKAIEAVKGGMRNVVHADYGTGKKGALGFATMCGKTGTAQWIPTKEQRLAWFAGFFPDDNPRYAFAVVYEGSPGESISGGKQAAPMIRRFFKHFQKEIEEAIKPPPKALIIVEEDEEGAVQAAEVVEEPTGIRSAEPVPDPAFIESIENAPEALPGEE